VEFVVGWSEDGSRASACAEELRKATVPFEKLPDRVIGYGAKAIALVPEMQSRLAVPEVIRRRATLEDVFLRLTGRALRD
jgi:hypothetical protein